MAGRQVKIAILGDAKSFVASVAKAEGASAKLAKAGSLAGAAIATGAVAAGVGLFKLGQSFDEQFDKIRIGTGATGDALKGLEGSFKTVLKSGPQSFDQVGTAIADLNTRLGLTGKPLEDLSRSFLDLSHITQTDVKTNVDNLTRAFGDWGVEAKDQTKTLDKFYRASQASGIGLDDLSRSIVQFGAPLRNLGFGLDQSLALLALFNKTGVNTETVFAGLKAGVGKLAKSGEDVPSTFKRIVKEIVKLGPGTDATRLAIELFGQRAGPDLADAITGGKFAIDDMWDAIANGSDTIAQGAKDTADFSEKWNTFKNRVLVGLEPLASKVFDGVGRAMDTLAAWWDENGPRITQQVKDVIDKGFALLKSWWDDNGPTILTVINTLKDGAKLAFEKLIEAGKFVLDHWDEFKIAAGVMVAIVIPHYVALGVGATASAAVQVAAWATSNVAAVAATVIHSAEVVKQVAQWVILGTKAAFHAAVVAASWLVSTASSAISTTATIVAVTAQSGAWAGLAVAAETSAARIAKAWALAAGPLGLVVAGAEGINQATGNKLSPGKHKSLLGNLTHPFEGLSFGLRAHGGSVAAGAPYMVGERGPELFMPGRSGTIIPNHNLGGGGVVINVNGAGDPEATAQAVRRELLRLGRRNGTIFGDLA